MKKRITCYFFGANFFFRAYDLRIHAHCLVFCKKKKNGGEETYILVYNVHTHTLTFFRSVILSHLHDLLINCGQKTTNKPKSTNKVKSTKVKSDDFRIPEME